MTTQENAKGLMINTATGKQFNVYGFVEYRNGTYFCAGESWPEEIVVGVLQEVSA